MLSGTGSDGTNVSITGGNPLDIPVSAPVTLCARSDLEPSRFYNGALANLGIWDVQLTPTQIQAIYQQVHCYVHTIDVTL
jgi:hypothetical protein